MRTPVLAGPIGHGFQVEGPKALAAAGQPSDTECQCRRHGLAGTGRPSPAGPSYAQAVIFGWAAAATAARVTASSITNIPCTYFTMLNIT